MGAPFVSELESREQIIEFCSISLESVASCQLGEMIKKNVKMVEISEIGSML